MIWVQKRTGFPATTITSKDEAQLFLSKDMTAVVGYFDKFEVMSLSGLCVVVDHYTYFTVYEVQWVHNFLMQAISGTVVVV